MADYNDILTDPTNPIVIEGHKVTFPSWITDDVLDTDTITLGKNMTVEDVIIRKHASYYDATIWYPWVERWSPKSVFMDLGDVIATTTGTFPEHMKPAVVKLINDGYNFVKTTTKSSHNLTRVTSYEDFLDEVTHPNLVMSFKKGCRTLFFREYIDDIKAEYRIYFHGGVIKYVEEYKRVSGFTTLSYEAVATFANTVNANVRYKDYVLDICWCPTGFLVIEINTPFYLFGGLHLCGYQFYLDKIHNHEPVFVYRDDEGEIVVRSVSR
jgi:hypothetical protein